VSRFYVPPHNVKNNSIDVTGREAHHILDVMRLKEGDEVVIFDGTGREYSGFIKEADKKHKKAVVQIVKTECPLKDSLPEIILAQALPKKSKMDYIVEKATELGVSQVIPLISERTIVRPKGDSGIKKVERWKKISLEAAKQCGRVDTPLIHAIMPFDLLAGKVSHYDLTLLACLQDENISIKEAVKGMSSGKILILIGPEGDFTTKEIMMADHDNCRFVSLGKRVLKSDTAALFVLSVLNYEFSL